MKLSFGVVDVPYRIAAPARVRRVAMRGKRPIGAAPSGGQTTGDVAEILEGRYHVMEHFWEARGQEVADAITQDLADFFEDRMSGAPGNAVNYTAAESTTYTLFQQFIDGREMDRLGYPGIPTQAALKGVNHRLKHPYAKSNPPRPSFKDTGLYEQSFRAEVEE